MKTQHAVRMIGIECAHEDDLAPGQSLALHRHTNAYAALVLEGGYEEIAPEGRHACRAGQIIIHPSYHAHADRIGDQGARILNLPIDDHTADLAGYGVYETGDVESFKRRCLNSDAELPGLLASGLVIADATKPPAWLSGFLADLLDGMPAAHAARRNGRSLEHAGRVCRRWYGMTPVNLRRERRLRRAMAELRLGGKPADIAVECGFADQPHLTRALKKLTGRTPAAFAAGNSAP